MRTAAKDITFHGVDIPKGSVVNVRYAAANRDERAFDEPERINLERKKSRFAYGVWLRNPSLPGSSISKERTMVGL